MTIQVAPLTADWVDEAYAEFGLFAPLATPLVGGGCAICLCQEAEGER